MIRRPPRFTLSSSSAASDVYKRQATKEIAARGAPVVIVVRLVSAIRRPTVLYPHPDRAGRPATNAARRTSGRQPATPTNFRWRPLSRRPDRPDGGDRESRASFIVSDSRGTTCSAPKPIADVSGDRVLGPPLPAATPS